MEVVAREEVEGHMRRGEGMSSRIKRKRLDELIALAKCGKKFSARRPDSLCQVGFNQEHFKQCNGWSSNDVTTLWGYVEDREPRVVEFEATVKTHGRHNLVVEIEHESLRPLVGRKVKVVCTEVIE